jgi:kojibiose phosphorylase
MTVDIRALIFDLDGVIADTLELHFRAWQRLSQEEHILFTTEQYQRMQGLTRPASLQIFLNGRTLSEAATQEWMTRKNRYFLEQLPHLSGKPGAAELIQEAKAAGIKIGLGSSSQNARLVLERLGLTASFDVIADGSTVLNNKPAPDIFLWVGKQLAVTPAQSVVFEDAEAGMQAALAGGFWTVGVGSDYDTRPHIALNSLTEITCSSLQNRLGAIANHSPKLAK